MGRAGQGVFKSAVMNGHLGVTYIKLDIRSTSIINIDISIHQHTLLGNLNQDHDEAKPQSARCGLAGLIYHRPTSPLGRVVITCGEFAEPT